MKVNFFLFIESIGQRVVRRLLRRRWRRIVHRGHLLQLRIVRDEQCLYLDKLIYLLKQSIHVPSVIKNFLLLVLLLLAFRILLQDLQKGVLPFLAQLGHVLALIGKAIQDVLV